jgi:hypothetical protein
MKKVKPTQKRRKGKTERVPYLFRGRYSGSRVKPSRAPPPHMPPRYPSLIWRPCKGINNLQYQQVRICNALERGWKRGGRGRYSRHCPHSIPNAQLKAHVRSKSKLNTGGVGWGGKRISTWGICPRQRNVFKNRAPRITSFSQGQFADKTPRA